ncbi:MAG: RIP metalloprotease RseP [Parcubacteria group bacterium]|nr:RIP metalloprotease RseP [Parcubacteria group bacterium]
MNIIIFLIVLAVLILVHEFGHFIVAKKSGIRVDEFGFGFPPKLFGIKKGETEYTVNAIPFGGFVKIFGENPDDESLHGSDSARSFINKPKWVQTGVIVAGVGFNFLLAWILFSVGFISGLPMSVDENISGATIKDERLLITAVERNSPAEAAGLMAGDTIISLSAKNNTLSLPTALETQEFIARHEKEEIILTYQREKEKKEGSVVVMPVSGIVSDRPAIGIAMNSIGLVQLPFFKAIFEGGKMTVTLIGAIVVAFLGLIADAFKGSADLANLTGPVGIVSLVGDATNLGFAYLLSFVAFISINLGVLNLLPIPALDGGRLLFLIIEAIKGSPVNYKIVNTIHAAGFAILVLLMVLVTYNDIARLIGS